jgi:hypothetical protein
LSQLKYQAKHTDPAADWCTVHFPQPGIIHFYPGLIESGLTMLGFALQLEERHYLFEIHFRILGAIGLCCHPVLFVMAAPFLILLQIPSNVP